MIKNIIFSLLILGWLSSSYAVTHSKWVRVRMSSVPMSLQISGANLVFQGEGEKFKLAALKVKKEEKRIHLTRLGSRYGWVVSEVEETVLNPLAKKKNYQSPFLSISGERLKLNGKSMPPNLLLLPHTEKKQVEVIGLIDIEKYLQTVLASEVPASWPMEALKAQAVATRTYTLFKMERKSQKSFDLESTVMDQVFNYKKFQKLPRSLRKKVKRAVQETSGQVLVQANQKLIPAYYHSHCGGHGEEPHHVWGNGRFFKAKKDSFCKKAPGSRWRYHVAKKKMAKRLNLKGVVTRVKVLKRNSSGRVMSFLVENDKKHRLILTGQELRSALGFSRLKSTRFKYKVARKKIVFSGRGYGHGVGLCQWGARNAALKKLNHLDILSHYYPKAYVKSLGESKLASL